MQTVEQIIDRAERDCNTHGARLTDKRKQVLLSLLQSEKALSAYELIEVCKSEFGENLQAMSMYRILDFLQQERLVHKLHLANKYVACAHIACDHEHSAQQFLICSQCQKVEETKLSASVIAELEKNVEAAGFHFINQQLEMNCICHTCQAEAA